MLVSVSIPPDLYNEFMALFKGKMKLSQWFVAQMREVVAHEKAMRSAEGEEQKEKDDVFPT